MRLAHSSSWLRWRHRRFKAFFDAHGTRRFFGALYCRVALYGRPDGGCNADAVLALFWMERNWARSCGARRSAYLGFVLGDQWEVVAAQIHRAGQWVMIAAAAWRRPRHLSAMAAPSLAPRLPSRLLKLKTISPARSTNASAHRPFLFPVIIPGEGKGAVTRSDSRHRFRLPPLTFRKPLTRTIPLRSLMKEQGGWRFLSAIPPGAVCVSATADGSVPRAGPCSAGPAKRDLHLQKNREDARYGSTTLRR